MSEDNTFASTLNNKQSTFESPSILKSTPNR